MLVKTLQVSVHSEHETLWKLLMDRVQNPERYLPGVSEVRFLEQSDEVMVRELKLHGEVVRERIVIKPFEGELRHELLEHPQFTGVIVTKILRTARQSPVAPHILEYDLDLQRKSFKLEGLVKAEEEIVADLQMEMQRLKSRAEEMDGRH
jgi:hypothetical protein